MCYEEEGLVLFVLCGSEQWMMVSHKSCFGANRTFFVAAALVVFNACGRQKEGQVCGGNHVEVLEATISHEFDGEWVFVGMDHPWLEGDIYGWAGYLKIEGEKVKAHFVRSPGRVREGTNGPGPFFILEEDLGKVGVEYSWKLVFDGSDKGFAGGCLVEGTCLGTPLLRAAKESKGAEVLYLGSFDPPLKFRKIEDHSFYTEEDPHEEASDYEDVEDPFAEE